MSYLAQAFGSLWGIMSEAVFLIIYLLTYSSGFAGIAVCWFIRRQAIPGWINWYRRWLWSAIFFLLVRNGSYFAKRFLGLAAIESDLLFYVLYLVCSGVFVFFTIQFAFRFAYPQSIRLRAGLSIGGGGLVLGMAIFLVPVIPNAALIRDLMLNVVMYYGFGVVIASLVALACRYRHMPDQFERNIIKAFLGSGVVYGLFNGLQWLSYVNQSYSLQPFSMVNISLFAIFTANTILIGRRFLQLNSDETAKAPDLAITLYPGLTELESRIISLIKRGATNQEISQETGLSLALVKNKIFRLTNRYKVNSRIELLRAIKSQTSLADQTKVPQ